MPVVRKFSENDIACIATSGFTPLTAVENTAVTFNVNSSVSAGTTGANILSVTVHWGDGTSTALTQAVAPNWSGAHTYAVGTAGNKTIRVVTVLDNGQSQTDRYGPVVVTA